MTPRGWALTAATPGRDDTTGAGDREPIRGRFSMADTVSPREAELLQRIEELEAQSAPAATPGRDELREQIAAAVHAILPFRWDTAASITDAVMEPVDAWVAARTAESRDGWQATLDAALRERGTYRAAVAAGPRRTTDVYRQLSEATAAVARVRALCDEAERLHKNTPAANIRIAAALINDIRAALPPRDPSAPPAESLTTEQTRGSE